MCGRSADTQEFNSEHVIPTWLLGRHTLHSRTITLPNGAHYMYGKLKIPLCMECNSRLAMVLEDPISRAFTAGHNAVVHFVRTGGHKPLFLWMSLIFLKSYLKDREHRLHLDQRIGSETIAEQVDWVDMHHIHCMIRSLHTGAVLEEKALGSLFVFPVMPDGTEEFDYADILGPKCALLRSEDTAIIAIFDDACAVGTVFHPFLSRLRFPLKPIQLRELLARMASVNLSLKQRPNFYSRVADDGAGWVITGEIPEFVELEPIDPLIEGRLLEKLLVPLQNEFPPSEREYICDQIRKNEWTFLEDLMSTESLNESD
jgi:hypothetical protein